MSNVNVQTEDFDLNDEVKKLRSLGDSTDDTLDARVDSKVGAVVTFVGFVRDINDGDDVKGLSLEHYPGMTEKSIESIIAESKQRWSVLNARVIHRVGDLLPADQIVYVGVSSMHRGDAFAAAEFIMDYLKTKAPFWKKEITGEGDRWVDARSSDTSAADRWAE